jgi:hypothetical protein
VRKKSYVIRSSGIASDNPFTVRALAFIIPGHVTHHLRIVQERYMLAA